MRHHLLPLFITLALLPIQNLYAEIKIFKADSLSAIEEKYQGLPFILAVWSIECPPCRDELALLGKLKEDGQQFNLILVSTDNISQHPLLSEILSEYQLQHQDNWAFGKQSPERLRYSLDPNWFGEMPRCYFYDASHQRIGISGKLQSEQVLEWLSNR